MNIVAAVERAAAVGLLRDHLAVAPIVGIAPAHRTPGLPAFPGIVFGLLGQLTITRVERAADLVADNAADQGAGEGAGDAPAAFAELIADHATGDGAHQRTAVLLGLAARQHERGRADQHRRSHSNLPRLPRPPPSRARRLGPSPANRKLRAMRTRIWAKVRPGAHAGRPCRR